MSSEDEEYEEAVAFMRSVLVTAVASGWLRPVAHGYCWQCNTEGPVLDVMSHQVPDGAPSQPPRCEECFIESGLTVMSDPDAMSAIIDKSITDWLNDNGAA